MQPIDPKKVTDFLTEWNKERPTNNPLWKEVPGIYATTGMKIEENTTVTFQPNFGYPLKLFVNTETSEIKSFDARRFT